VIGALIATSGWGERRYDLFMRMASAEGITVDTRVIVQGLEVGRVRSVSPRVDSLSGTIAFVARLSVAETFADGSSLRFPLGTRAEIDGSNPLAQARINLLLPDTVGRLRAFLEPGDTVDARRKSSAMDQVATVAEDISRQLEDVLRQTSRTLSGIQGTIARVAPGMDSTLGYVASTMERLNAFVARVDRAGMADSVSAMVASTNRLLARLDSLAGDARSVAVRNGAALGETMQNLNALTRRLNHFVDEMSRRPYRLLTGVRPLRPDSAQAGDSIVARREP
jgi:ABC-type transporter Mla subunit MlaD